jgi:hypothetical protein
LKSNLYRYVMENVCTMEPSFYGLQVPVGAAGAGAVGAALGAQGGGDDAAIAARARQAAASVASIEVGRCTLCILLTHLLLV